MSGSTNTHESEKPAETTANSTHGNGGAEQTAQQPAAPTPAEYEAKIQEEKNKYLYLYADFENYKKRTVKERSDLIKFGWEPVARELLQVVDNLERAVQHAPTTTDKNLLQGLQMVLAHFKDTLQKQGVQGVQSLNQNFDPNFHEAIATEPSQHPDGTITQEHTAGYTLHGRLLRPARVTVSGGNSKPAEKAV